MESEEDIGQAVYACPCILCGYACCRCSLHTSFCHTLHTASADLGIQYEVIQLALSRIPYRRYMADLALREICGEG